VTGDVPVTIPSGPAREAARHELSKPIYHQNDPSLFHRALNWIWQKIDDLFSAASGVTPGGAVGLVVVIALVIGLLVALRLRLGKLRTATLPSAGLFADAPRTAAEHRSAAEHFARLGQWTPAVQERLRAIVRSLEERTVLDPRPGRTADEAAAEAGQLLPVHAAPLRDAAHTFDDVTYGGRTATQQAYAALRDLDAELERSKPRFADAAPAPGGARA
jgi:hypothetical protein